MQHNLQKSVQAKDETFGHETIRDNQFNLRNIYPEHINIPDVGRGTDEHDNIRRQKQDYFDNWQPQNNN